MRDDAEASAVMYRESDLSDEIVEDTAKIKRHRDTFERVWHAVPDEQTASAKIRARIHELATG